MTAARPALSPAPAPVPAGGPAAGFRLALIVDDHPLFCDALAMTLRAVAGVLDAETADSLAAAADRLARPPRPDLVVLDLDLPDASGLDGLVRLRALAAPAPVVIVSSVDDRRIVAAAMAAGAAGFVPKHSRHEVFREAFAVLAAGHAWTPDGTFDGPAPKRPPGGTPDEAIRRLGRLTPQQARILDLVCEGRLNKQIAHELGIADATVKAHVTAILRKLGVQTRTQAVLLAREVSYARILRDGSAPR